MKYLRFDTACDNCLQLQEMHDFTIRSAYSSLPCTTMEQSFASQQGNAQNNKKKKKKRKRTGSPKVLPNVKASVYDNNTWKFETNENNGVRTGNILNRSDSVRSSCSSGSESFGSESTLRHKSSSDGIFSSMPPFSHQIILVHDPVAISNEDRGSGKYNGICSQLLQFHHPVVLVLSQAGERDGVNWALNDLIPVEIQARYVEFSRVYVTVDMIFS